MASKSDIAEFISKIDFDEKLISINKNVTLNKKKTCTSSRWNKKLQTFEASILYQSKLIFKWWTIRFSSISTGFKHFHCIVI